MSLSKITNGEPWGEPLNTNTLNNAHGCFASIAHLNQKDIVWRIGEVVRDTRLWPTRPGFDSHQLRFDFFFYFNNFLIKSICQAHKYGLICSKSIYFHYFSVSIPIFYII